MEHWEREYLVSQIVSSTVLCDVDGKIYVYKNPSSENKYFANKIYKDIYEESKKEKIWTEEELLSYMIMSQQWSSEEEDKSNKLNEDVNKLKIRIYELRLQPTDQQLVRFALKDTRQKIEELHMKKYALYHLCCEGIASSAKFRYLIGAGLYYKDKPYWKNYSGWNKPDYLLDTIINKITQSKIDDVVIRELSRNEPWRSYWICSKSSGAGIFGKPSIDLTDYQKNIILYSQMYDNILESAECPCEEIINDDDALDGWILLQKQQKEGEDNKNNILSGIKNEKIRNSEEVFIRAKTQEEVEKIFDANDLAGKIAFNQRMKQIKEEKEVNEIDLRETKMRIMMSANR